MVTAYNLFYIFYIYIYYICNHENNMLSQLSPQWLCGNSHTWAHDIRLYITGTNEPKSARGSLMTSYIMLLA